MRRFTVLYILLFAVGAASSTASAQDARQRQAAAEAYDRGTAAYLEGSYGEAAQWFETANRMAPAAPALMQAIRAHEHAENHTRAATLAIELQNTYASEPQATDYAKNVLANTAPKLLLIQVTCDEDCKLDVDGKLQEYLSFFETPGQPHTLTATFETGSKTTRVQGEAGQKRDVQFEAPPPPPTPPIDFSADATQSKDGTAGRPLPPLVTWIGIGVTGAVLAATIVSAVDMYNGVPGYKKAAEQSVNCSMTMGATAMCSSLARKAQDELDKGQSRELRTNILIGATAFAAVSTGVIALFLTDWSSHDAKPADETLGLRVEPRPGGLSTTLEGRF